MKTILITLFLLPATWASAQTAPASAPREISQATADLYYLTGKAAYDKKEYLTALEYLFAYKTINAKAVNAIPQDKAWKSVLDAIKDCEEKINLGLSRTPFPMSLENGKGPIKVRVEAQDRGNY